MKGESASQYHYGFGPVYPNEGLMKPRRGFTLAAGEEKLGVGKVSFLVDPSIFSRNNETSDLPEGIGFRAELFQGIDGYLHQFF